jgi:hypothetical protein
LRKQLLEFLDRASRHGTFIRLDVLRILNAQLTPKSANSGWNFARTWLRTENQRRKECKEPDDSLRRYLAARIPTWGGIPVEVVKDIPKQDVQAVWLGGCQRTYVVSPEGRMIQNFTGSWRSPHQRTNVEKYFGINVPDYFVR